MAGYKNGKVEIWYGDNPPSNLNILWQKRIVNGSTESSELMQYNPGLNTWHPLINSDKAPIANPNFIGTATLNGEPIGQSNLNGTSYLMVYGVGTPEENAAELQAAYDEAKTMPRYIGSISLGDASKTYYKGQTYYQTEYDVYRRMLSTVTSVGNGMVVNNEYSEVITESEAKSTRTTVIVAPGGYNFESVAFLVESSGIDITSLTGNSDVIISNVSVNSDFLKISGVNGTINFDANVPITNVVIEKCVSLHYGFAMRTLEVFNVKFIDCVGGDDSFVTDVVSNPTECEFWRCNGGSNSFLNQEGSSFYYCTSGAGSNIGSGDYVFFCVENLTALPNS